VLPCFGVREGGEEGICLHRLEKKRRGKPQNLPKGKKESTAVEGKKREARRLLYATLEEKGGGHSRPGGQILLSLLRHYNAGGFRHSPLFRERRVEGRGGTGGAALLTVCWRGESAHPTAKFTRGKGREKGKDWTPACLRRAGAVPPLMTQASEGEKSNQKHTRARTCRTIRKGTR